MTASAAGLDQTGDVPSYATIILLQTRTRDPAPKSGSQRIFTVENKRPGKCNEEKEYGYTGEMSFSFSGI